jgi:hypothetical protein
MIMTNSTDTLTTEIWPIRLDDGLEVEASDTEEKAQAAFDTVRSSAVQQAAAFLAETATIKSSCSGASRSKGAREMTHTVRHRTAGHGKRSRLDMHQVRLWITLHAQVCECCGAALWGRRYTNTVFQPVCRGCYLAGLPARRTASSDGEQASPEED